ncbi:MAG: hypothetical protein WAT19_15110 [Ferruginibacter sp.]
MKLKFAVAFFLTFPFAFAQAQLGGAELAILSKKEDSLKKHAAEIIRGKQATDRFLADSQFTKIFVRALAVKNSFQYPFDSLQTISKLYAPDSSFRILTWQMVINDNVIRQHGAIQMRTTNGSLKLFPLIDKSDICINPTDTIADNKGWIGAVYYKIVLKESNGKKYYTLLGFDENNIRSTKKVIEILSFSDGRPVFGGRNFIIPKEYMQSVNAARYIMEFSKDASPRLTYDPELDMIIMEHLVSNSGDVKKKWTLIPDGDYEGFRWTNGRWNYVNKIFSQVTPENQPPVPTPLSNPAVEDLDKIPAAKPPAAKPKKKD